MGVSATVLVSGVPVSGVMTAAALMGIVAVTGGAAATTVGGGVTMGDGVTVGASACGGGSGVAVKVGTTMDRRLGDGTRLGVTAKEAAAAQQQG